MFFQLVEPIGYSGKPPIAIESIADDSRCAVVVHDYGDLQLRIALQSESGSEIRTLRKGEGPADLETVLAAIETEEGSLVVRVEGQDALAERLNDLGFWPGTPVSVLRRSAFGGPVAFRLRGYRLALRRSEAARVVIALDCEPG